MATSRSHVDPKIIEVAVALSDIEAVSDHKLVGETKAYVAKIGFHLLHAFFQKKRTHFKTGWVPSGKVFAEIIEREPTIDNVFDNDDIAPGQIDIEVLDNANDTAMKSSSTGSAIARAISAINITAPLRTAMSNGARPA
jgi:hypothetical protein